MKRNKYIIILFLISFFTKAQVNYAWFPIKPNVQNNYTIDSSNVPIASIIKIDSFSVNTPAWYYLNKIVTPCDTCQDQYLVNDYNDSTYVLNHQPQFLKHAFTKLSDSVFYFKGPHSFVVKPYASIGIQWLYDSILNITAKVFSRTTALILGNTDSICSVKLSTGDTIILSKNYGIVQFPIKTITIHTYKLVGIQGISNVAVQLKSFHDFFNFNAGDVFQYSFTNNDFNLFPPMLQEGNERWDILSVNVFNDSINCSIKITHFDSLKYGASLPAITSYTSISTVSFIDSTKHLANLYPLQEIMTNPFYIINNGVRGIHKVNYSINQNQKIEKSFGENCPNVSLSIGNTGAAEITNFPSIYLNRNQTKVVGRKLTEGLGFTSELFNDEDIVYERCMIGYIKGSDTSGVILEGDPSSIKQNSAENKFSIYPVPANNTISVFGKLDEITSIYLTNLLGEKLIDFKSFPDKIFSIDVSQFANGIYFIVISKQNYTETKKLIIQH